MEKSGKPGKSGERKVPASFITGAVALVFLVTGYQTALFVHKAATAAILAGRDSPDTVYVAVQGYPPEGAGEDLSAMAEQQYSSGRPSRMPSGQSPGETVLSYGNAARVLTETRVPIVRRNADHHPAVESIRESYPAAKTETFRFNPNTATVEELVRLGFTPRQARSLDNYRKKGGRFRRRSDFAKSYVVSDTMFRRLEPYIDIPLLDLNLADSAEFDALPGIGGYFASGMVEYRRRLGGSYSFKEQLMDIWKFDKEKYDGLSDLVTIDTSHVKPYPLWSLPEDSLRIHPYIRYADVAHGIVLFRENNPVSSWSVEALEKAGIISPEMAGKLARCRIEHP